MDKKKERTARLLYSVIVAAILLFLLAPIVVVILGSFNGTTYYTFPPEKWGLLQYRRALGKWEYIYSLKASLAVSTIATAISTFLCLLAALSLRKMRPQPRSLIEQVLYSPLVLPSIVWALSLLILLGRLNIRSNMAIISVVHTVIAAPFVLRVVSASISEFDPKLEDAAASLGANPWRTFRLVTFPIILPGVLVGAVFGFMHSFGEVILTMFISSAGFSTFPVRVFSEAINEGLNLIVFAYSTLIILTLLLVSTLAEKCAGWSRYF